MSDPPRRRPGRPSIREGERSTHFNLTLPDSDYDRLFALAQHHGMTVPALARTVLTKALHLDARPK